MREDESRNKGHLGGQFRELETPISKLSWAAISICVTSDIPYSVISLIATVHCYEARYLKDTGEELQAKTKGSFTWES